MLAWSGQVLGGNAGYAVVQCNFLGEGVVQVAGTRIVECQTRCCFITRYRTISDIDKDSVE